jgi:hypothetical protein
MLTAYVFESRLQLVTQVPRLRIVLKGCGLTPPFLLALAATSFCAQSLNTSTLLSIDNFDNLSYHSL